MEYRHDKKDIELINVKGLNLFYKLPVIMYSGAAYPYVPIIRVETWDLSPTGPSLASPKSESFALYSCMHNMYIS